MPASDLPGSAIADYYFHKSKAKLWVHDTFGPRVEMPIAHYFRIQKEMPLIEQIALQECRGTVLDVGAGAGSHALALQELGFIVDALEISPASASVMEARGVAHVICQDFFTLESVKYDTLLFLMNGIGIAGSLTGLKKLLRKSKELLKTGGQLLFDSSNVEYLYDDDVPPTLGKYYGEIEVQYAYRQQCGPWFTWLYADQETLGKYAKEEGWKMELLFEDDDNQFLLRFTKQ